MIIEFDKEQIGGTSDACKSKNMQSDAPACDNCKYWAEAIKHNYTDPYGEYYCPYDIAECDEHNSKFEPLEK